MVRCCTGSFLLPTSGWLCSLDRCPQKEPVTCTILHGNRPPDHSRELKLDLTRSRNDVEHSPACWDLPKVTLPSRRRLLGRLGQTRCFAVFNPILLSRTSVYTDAIAVSSRGLSSIRPAVFTRHFSSNACCAVFIFKTPLNHLPITTITCLPSADIINLRRRSQPNVSGHRTHH